MPVCLANPEKYQCGFFHGILLKTTRLNFWKRDRRQPSNKDKIATFMAEAEIIIKSWNPKMAKNQVSHFLVTGKKEPPNLVSLPCSVFFLHKRTYFIFSSIWYWFLKMVGFNCRTKCISFTWIIMLSFFKVQLLRKAELYNMNYSSVCDHFIYNLHFLWKILCFKFNKTFQFTIFES